MADVEARIGEIPDTDLTTINSTPVEASNEKSHAKDEKSHYAQVDVASSTGKPDDDASDIVLHDERQIATHVISVDDDSSLNPWTFRSFFIGLGLSAFGASLGMIILALFMTPAHTCLQPKYIISSQCAKHVSSLSLSDRLL
jgi:hypothetical protein